MKYIYICGMYRSGSTWSFNVVKFFALKQGLKVTYAASGNIEQLGVADVGILKFHHDPSIATLNAIEQFSIPIIVTMRPPKESIASLMDVFGYSFEAALDSVGQSLDWILSVKNRALVVRYPEINCNFIRASFTAHKILDFAYGKSGWLDSFLTAYHYRKTALKKQTDSMVCKEGEVVDIGFSYYDKNTLLHRKHIGNPQRLKSMIFTVEQEEKIKHRLEDKYLRILSFIQNH